MATPMRHSQPFLEMGPSLVNMGFKNGLGLCMTRTAGRSAADTIERFLLIANDAYSKISFWCSFLFCLT